MSEIGRLLSLKRLQAGLSQEELSERIDYDRGYISLVETGKRQPGVKFLRAVADVLHLPLPMLLRTAGIVEDTAALETEIAALVAANPAFAGILEFARAHPDQLPEVLRFARYLVSGAPEESEAHAAAEPRGRPAESHP